MEKLFKKGTTSQLTSKAFGFVEKEVSKGLTAINTLTKSQESKEDTLHVGAQVKDNLSNQKVENNEVNYSQEDQSVQEESKPIQEIVTPIKLQDHPDDEKEQYNEGEDSEKEVPRMNSEKEVETVIQTVREGIGANLKKEHKAGHVEKTLMEIGTSAMEASENFPEFLQNFGAVHTIEELALHILSDLVIDKMVGEVPERYRFMLKAATTIAVQQGIAMITGVPPISALSIVILKVDMLKKKKWTR